MSGQSAQPERVDDVEDESNQVVSIGSYTRLRRRRQGAGRWGARARVGLRRDELTYFETVDELVDALWDDPGVAEPEIRRAVEQYGAGIVEGAWFATVNAGDLRSPVGWFFSTMKGGYAWSPEEIERPVDRSGAATRETADDRWLRRRQEAQERKQAGK